MALTAQSIDQFKMKGFRAISHNLGEFILAQLLKKKTWMVVSWLLFLQTRSRSLYTAQSLVHSFIVSGGRRSSPPKAFWNCSHSWPCSGACFPSAASRTGWGRRNLSHHWQEPCVSCPLQTGRMEWPSPTLCCSYQTLILQFCLRRKGNEHFYITHCRWTGITEFKGSYTEEGSHLQIKQVLHICIICE